MNSPKHATSSDADFDFGPWASEADRAAMRADGRRPMTPEEYEQFLAQFPADPEALRKRKVFRGEAFRL